jgi:hypothetical protein
VTLKRGQKRRSPLHVASSPCHWTSLLPHVHVTPYVMYECGRFVPERIGQRGELLMYVCLLLERRVECPRRRHIEEGVEERFYACVRGKRGRLTWCGLNNPGGRSAGIKFDPT